MTISDIFELLHARNVQLSVVDDDLVVRGEKRALDSSVVTLLREKKHDLIDYLRSEEYVRRQSAATADVPPNLIPPGCAAITSEMLPLVALAQQEIDRIVASVSGGAANVQDIYPLAPLQDGFLFHHLMTAEGDPYLFRRLLRFRDRARLDDYLAAWQAVVDRNDMLRTAVFWEGLTAPVQVVWRQASIAPEEIVFDPADGDVSWQLWNRFDALHYRIDIRKAPLMRSYATRDPLTGQWYLLICSHHLATDHTTLELLDSEIEAFLAGRGNELPPALPFRTFVGQARRDEEPHRAFFSRSLGDVDEPTAPFGLTAVQGDGSGIHEQMVRLDSGLSRRLRVRARRMGVSVASLFHLAWAMVVARTSGRDDTVFGTILFGRMQGGQGADSVMGVFMNTLPLRIAVGDQSVDASVRAAQQSLADLMLHEHASLALAQRCSRVAAPAPLFSSLLNYRHSETFTATQSAESRRAWDGIEVLYNADRSNYPLVMTVDDLGEDFELETQVQSSVDPQLVCAMMATALEGLVEALECAPETSVSAIDVLPHDVRRALIEERNATARPYASEHCVHELFEEQVAKTPAAIALVQQDQKLTYEELNRRANQLAHYLRSVGIGPEERVALCAECNIDTIVALLAILKAGGAYVPLDPGYPAERLAYMLADSRPSLVLSDGAVEAMEVPVIDLRPEYWSQMAETNPDRGGLRPEHLAYVIYTSGSTGRPKGVMIPHRGVCNLVAAQIDGFGIDANSRLLQFASLSFDASVSEILTALCCGASLHIPAAGIVLAGEALQELITREAITHATLPPALLAAMPEEMDLGPLTTLIMAGEAASEALVRRWSKGRRLINAYGPTEATVCATMHECADEAGAPPIGRPIANARVYVLDAHGRPAPVGVVGEIHVGGVGVGRGYWNQPQLTDERFVRDPFVADRSARMYRTGDVGRYRRDGTIEYLGRNDEQVKIRGFRIEPAEIEAHLLAHDGVREAVVIARGESGDKRLVAYVVPAPGAELHIDELRRELAARLPESMIPAAFVSLDALPLTPNGKIDRKALQAFGHESYARREYEAPAGELEQTVAAIWSELLKIDRVGRHDGFFELGGHSLLAVSLMERMRSRGLRIDVRAIFAAPTVAGLASAAGRESGEVAIPPNLIHDIHTDTRSQSADSEAWELTI
jgi:amino acid adenylation domain-containing protein